MSWIGSCPRCWPEVVAVLQAAIRERAAAFGMEDYPAIESMQSVSVPTTSLRNRVLEIRDAVVSLVEYSIDPRQLGQWAATRPFSPFRRKRDALFDDLGIESGDFLCERIRPITNWKFAEACYRLLNEIALYRSVQFSFYATSGNIGLNGVEHFRSLEPGESSTDDYDRPFSVNGSSAYLARWCHESDRRWCDQLHFYNNNSPVTLTGSWKSRYTGTVLHRTNLNDNLALYSWNCTEVNWQGGTSESLALPLPAGLVQQVLYDHGDYVTREELLLDIDLPDEILLSAGNLPQLHYTYKD